MKTNRFLQLAASLALAMALTLSLGACGKEDPKSLAEQSMVVMKQSLGLMGKKSKPGDPEYDAVQKKTEELEKKVNNLSEEDKKIFESEIKKLLK